MYDESTFFKWSSILTFLLWSNRNHSISRFRFSSCNPFFFEYETFLIIFSVFFTFIFLEAMKYWYSLNLCKNQSHDYIKSSFNYREIRILCLAYSTNIVELVLSIPQSLWIIIPRNASGQKSWSTLNICHTHWTYAAKIIKYRFPMRITLKENRRLKDKCSNCLLGNVSSWMILLTDW